MTSAVRSARRDGKQSGRRGRIVAVRELFGPLTAWLGRPLASFHLLLAVFGLLTAIGLGMVASASSVQSYQIGNSSVYTLFRKQLAFALIGLVVFWLGARMPLRRIRALSGSMVTVCVLLLILVLTPVAHPATTTRGFLVFGPVSFQPVELTKLALALWGAHVLVSKRAVLHQYRHLLVPVMPVGLIMLTLVVLQPDLGSTITLGVVLIALLWFIGAPLPLFSAITLGSLGGVAILAVSASYRHGRVVSFLHPDANLSDAGYQAIESKFALADGGLFGRGLGMGASKFQYLPHVDTDFIFAVIGEELGLIGCALILGLFAMLAIVGMRIAARNIDPWIRVVASTLTTWLIAQAAINIGYVVGLLPVTGIPLPMISYGGTSLVVTMLVFGVLANCARHEPEAVAALRSQGPGKVGGLLRLPAPEVYQPPVQRRRATRPSTPPRGAARPARSASRGASLPPAEERRRTTRSAPVADRRRAGWRTHEQRWSSGRYGPGRSAGRTTEGGDR